MMSEFVFFKYFIDEIVILKNLWICLNSKSDIKSCCLWGEGIIGFFHNLLMLILVLLLVYLRLQEALFLDVMFSFHSMWEF